MLANAGPADHASCHLVKHRDASLPHSGGVKCASPNNPGRGHTEMGSGGEEIVKNHVGEGMGRATAKRRAAGQRGRSAAACPIAAVARPCCHRVQSGQGCGEVLASGAMPDAQLALPVHCAEGRPLRTQSSSSALHSGGGRAWRGSRWRPGRSGAAPAGRGGREDGNSEHPSPLLPAQHGRASGGPCLSPGGTYRRPGSRHCGST